MESYHRIDYRFVAKPKVERKPLFVRLIETREKAMWAFLIILGILTFVYCGVMIMTTPIVEDETDEVEQIAEFYVPEEESMYSVEPVETLPPMPEKSIETSAVMEEMRFISEETIAPVRAVAKAAPVSNYYAIPLSNEVQDFMFQECSRYGIPSGLVVAIMETESRFTENIISKTNDYGLMQINACCHEWLHNNLGVTNLLDAKENILSGIFILRYHLDYCNGDLRKALMCYACGAGRAEYYFNQGIYETEYTKDLINRMEKWEATLG